ncbi:MAG: 1-deoxy-D-xylulose-5-phosphate reductoisomerase, partial [Ruthenibacterium sp.]
MTKRITLLGSTGSIGTQSLDVIRAQGYRVAGLAAHSNTDLLLRQIAEFHPSAVAVVDDAAAESMERALTGMACAPKLLRGKEGLVQLASMDKSDIVLNAVVGIAGLAATLAAIESGRDVALANNESHVTGGYLVTNA